MGATAQAVPLQVSPMVETTIIAALVHYGLACADGSHCVDALRDLGYDRSADVLRDALDAR
jgi:hypothetical protein